MYRPGKSGGTDSWAVPCVLLEYLTKTRQPAQGGPSQVWHVQTPFEAFTMIQDVSQLHQGVREGKTGFVCGDAMFGSIVWFCIMYPRCVSLFPFVLYQ